MQANCDDEPNSRLLGLASYCQLSRPSVLCLTRSSSFWFDRNCSAVHQWMAFSRLPLKEELGLDTD